MPIFKLKPSKLKSTMDADTSASAPPAPILTGAGPECPDADSAAAVRGAVSSREISERADFPRHRQPVQRLMYRCS